MAGLGMKVSDFGQKQLAKFGWQQGKGLGKNEDGISTYIRVRLKKNNSGVGCDPSESTRGLWWDRLYNDVASRFQIPVQPDGSDAATAEVPSASGSDSSSECSDAPSPRRPSDPDVDHDVNPDVIAFASAPAPSPRQRTSTPQPAVAQPYAGFFVKTSTMTSAITPASDLSPPTPPPSAASGSTSGEALGGGRDWDTVAFAVCEGRTCKQNFGQEGKMRRIRAQELAYAAARRKIQENRTATTSAGTAPSSSATSSAPATRQAQGIVSRGNGRAEGKQKEVEVEVGLDSEAGGEDLSVPDVQEELLLGDVEAAHASDGRKKRKKKRSKMHRQDDSVEVLPPADLGVLDERIDDAVSVEADADSGRAERRKKRKKVSAVDSQDD
mmetsp:Transcript_23239/g.39963  ORF Transcript_23239/g.39963 Transcript_23239/m.39963 type:complete len:383 (-) Transcript_23239:369-1517(-)|eukprot:CAMPEP_0196663890 /NCGR_PEP_ID=MMETSP1086-20130531/54625_1 /TAXON_ID=77921 /ORGANISM="Cyanoptyche  gloeocystis , Strain SAG4.97" /LENGTH=382 /DNA_ID=CAMNT_0041999889 /DNA_START=68 /DNA_END=1216 /DNA_ORIENTATION=-